MSSCVGTPAGYSFGPLISGSGTSDGSSYVAYCTTGYSSSSSSGTLTCTSGVWVANPVCNMVNCGTPSINTAGYVLGSTSGTNEFGSTYSLTCSSDYVRVSGTDSIITCQSNGAWTDPTGCALSDCGAPAGATGYSLGGVFSTAYEATVDVFCAIGYLGTPPDITCQLSADWTSFTGCSLADCGIPSESDGYTIGSGSSTVYQSTYSISCASGFSGTPEAISCQASGSWSSPFGCYPNCSSAPTQTNYVIAEGSSSYGSSRTVSCGTGYTGSATTIFCGISGAWGTSSGCNPVDCSTPVPSEGYALGPATATTFGSYYSMSCVSGFAGSGTTLECLASGQWTAQTGCILINCENPIASVGYVIATGSTTYGSSLDVMCDAGYTGSPLALTCQLSGSWTSQTGCSANSCTPTSISNSDKAASGSVTGTTGQSVVVACDMGYSGSGTVGCESTGAFSTLSCTANSCTPTSISNSDKAASGSVTGTTGQSVVVICDMGYSGSGTVVCESTGAFSTLACNQDSPSSTACVSASIPHSDKASVDSISGTVGQSVVVTCDPGYYGSGSVTCESTGFFTSLTCNLISACSSTQVANSDKAAQNSISGFIGSSVMVTCNAGYFGSGMVTCASSGAFSIRTCVANSCASTQIANSNRAAIGSIMGSTGQSVTVFCDSGYSGSASVTCLSSGYFSSLVCSANSCDHAGGIANSDKTAADSISGNTGDSVLVTCNDGYSGSDLTTCNNNGYFSTLPVCVPVACQPLSILNAQNASEFLVGITGDKISVQCSVGTLINYTCVAVGPAASNWTATGNATECSDTLSGALNVYPFAGLIVLLALASVS